MGEDFLLPTFVHYFQTLGLGQHIQSSAQLYNGVVIAQFLALAQGSSIASHLIIRDEGIYGAAISNLKLIKGEIEKFEKNNNKIQSKEAQLNIYEVYSDQNEEQLIKLLKKCFILIAKAPNNSYFIQKILTLPQNEQLVFLKLLKEDGNFYQSPNRQIPNSEKNDMKDSRSTSDLEIIDKLYELQVQNERLQQEMKKLLGQNTQLQENNLDLMLQIETLKSQTENLKHELYQSSQTVLKLRSSNQKQQQKENKNEVSRKQLEKVLTNCKQEIQFMAVQIQSSRKKYEMKVKELEIDLKKEKETNDRIRQQLEYSQKQMEQLIAKFQQNQKELKNANKRISQIEIALKQLQELENALRFEVNYKNSQIQQLKEMIMNNSDTTPNRQQDEVTTSLKTPRNLAHQFLTQHTNISPRSNTSFKIDFQQLKALRAQVKQLQREKQKIGKLKIKNKELEYQKNKLVKILRDYQASRGQQNDIITGCLYELQMKFMGGKRSFSTDECGHC